MTLKLLYERYEECLAISMSDTELVFLSVTTETAYLVTQKQETCLQDNRRQQI